MLLPNKSAGSEYTAAEWSQIKDEIQAFIQGSGMTLSASTLTQMRETVMRNTTAGQGCVAGGTANSITLTTRSPFVSGAPSVYQADATYSALITTTNTTATTVNINNIGAIPLKKNGYADELEAGDIAVPALYDFIIKADLSEAELVAKKAVVGAGAGDSVPWSAVVVKTDNYIIVSGDEGKLFQLSSSVNANKTFTVDGGFPADGIFYTQSDTTEFVGGGASGEVVKLLIDDGSTVYAPIYNGNGIERWSNTIAITGKLNRGNG